MKHIHFIGICGVGMSALAILWKKKGWKVTGSDAGFYPPVSLNLKKHQIDFYPGWHPAKMGRPDLVVVGNVAGSENPEWIAVQEENIPYVSYPELIAKNLVKRNSVVCAGTYGKTTTTALLAHILKNAGLTPAYMFGGISPSLELSADDPEQNEWSVLEGDEYKTSRWDNSPKFSHYSPTHLLLTAVKWDHADVYSTEEAYFAAFQSLVDSVPKEGLIVVSDNIQKNIVELLDREIVTYGKTKNTDYRYSNIQMTKNGTNFTIIHESEIFNLESPMIGEYMAENITGCFALADQININPATIIKSVASFSGLRRRLERRGSINGAEVYDDIAHSPTKAKSALETLRLICPGRLYVVFEPNTGNRQRASIPQYDNAFMSADEVIIPRLTGVKIKPDAEPPLEGEELAGVINRTHQQVNYYDDDGGLIAHLKQKTQPGDAVAFLGSHGFRGMMEDLIAGE